MKAQSKNLHSDVVLCLQENLESYTNVPFTIRSGIKREINRSEVYVAVVELETERHSEDEIESVGGKIQQALVENGIDSGKFVVSSLSRKPELIDVYTGESIAEKL